MFFSFFCVVKLQFIQHFVTRVKRSMNYEQKKIIITFKKEFFFLTNNFFEIELN